MVCCLHVQVRAIPELEPLIMDKLFWGAADSLVLNPLRPEEEQARAWRARVAEAAAVATSHLRAYLATYEAFLPLLRVDVNDYLREAAEGTASLAEMVEEVRADFAMVVYCAVEHQSGEVGEAATGPDALPAEDHTHGHV